MSAIAQTARRREPDPTYADVNRDIIRTLDPPGKGWFMDDPALAYRVGLPTHHDVLGNFDNGHATFVPMIAAWRVAEYCGMMSLEIIHRTSIAHATLACHGSRSPHHGRHAAHLSPLQRASRIMTPSKNSKSSPQIQEKKRRKILKLAAKR